jgi:hypothetical protein
MHRFFVTKVDLPCLISRKRDLIHGIATITVSSGEVRRRACAVHLVDQNLEPFEIRDLDHNAIDYKGSYIFIMYGEDAS